LKHFSVALFHDLERRGVQTICWPFGRTGATGERN